MYTYAYINVYMLYMYTYVRPHFDSVPVLTLGPHFHPVGTLTSLYLHWPSKWTLCQLEDIS